MATSGYIVCILGAKGGVGKSQFAANFAYSFASECRCKTLLIDLDQKACGDQSFITGMNSKKTIKDISSFKGHISPNILKEYISTNPQNVSYLGMPTDKLLAEDIDPEGLGRFLDKAKSIFPLTVIDCGSELTPPVLKALEHVTAIFMILTPDLLVLNQTKRLFSELKAMLFPKDMILFIGNQMQKGHPINQEVIGKAIGKSLFFSIVRDDQACINSLNQKKPVVVSNKSSGFAKSISECVRKISQKSVLQALSRLAAPKTLQNANFATKDKKNSNSWTELKSRVHKALVDEMDLKKSSNNNDPKELLIVREQTKKFVVDFLNKENVKSVIKNREDMGQIIKEILDEALGLGPLEDLLSDKECSEIMVVGYDKIYFEISGKIKKSEITFTNERQVINVIERIVAPIGRRIDEKTPYVDARLRDGSRVHAIIPPCAIDGSTITIRKFPENRLGYKDLVNFESITQNMADFLRIAVEGHRNIVVSGGTGSGKTTLINVLAGFIQTNERIITCEDSAELDLPQDHVVRLETRPPSLEGDGEINIRCLVKQTLRMRPDRILVGECRGGEALDMLQAMGTGHDGSMTTVHSNNPRECIGRLETLVQYAEAGLTARAIREMITSSVHLIVQQSRLDDGSRRVTHISEVGGMQGDVVTLQDIFIFQQSGMDKKGKIIGKFQATGFIPKFIENLEKKGYNIPRGLFSNKDESSNLKTTTVKPNPQIKKKAG